jgi:hypothetical protein
VFCHDLPRLCIQAISAITMTCYGRQSLDSLQFEDNSTLAPIRVEVLTPRNSILHHTHYHLPDFRWQYTSSDAVCQIRR